jgi:hypothetical protein
MSAIIEAKDANGNCYSTLQNREATDNINIRYRLPYNVHLNNHRDTIKAEVVLHFRLERMSSELALGDPIYSITLLPGEQVRMFCSDRHSRWSYDAESKLSYRHETTSEESFYTAAMAKAMSSLTITEQEHSENSYEESWANGGGGGSFGIDIGIIDFSLGGGGSGGSYSSKSTFDLAHNLAQYTAAASSSIASGIRAASSTSMGVVDTREHKEGESADHFESSSRTLQNANRGHAVNYIFHKINKIQKIRFSLVAIERGIAETNLLIQVKQRLPVNTSGGVSIMPQVIRADDPKRLAIEEMARTSALTKLNSSIKFNATTLHTTAEITLANNNKLALTPTLSDTVHSAALAQLDKELALIGLLDATTGKPTEKINQALSWEREEILPTPGVLVKGYLDDCNTCEPTLQEEIQLELERKRLENEKLKREIELLDKAQNYRCCPSDTVINPVM